MNLVNVAIENLGAKIKTSSSYIDDRHHPGNILKPNDNSLWTTTQGLPQFVIVSLEGLNVNYRSINQVKLLLWHDYDTNPKTIELWVAQTTNQEFILWTQFHLTQKKGIQMFQIKPLPSKFLYLKISITETYGAFQTYLNQVFLMADQVTQIKKNALAKQDIGVKRKKQLDLDDLQSGLNELIEMDRRISRTKSKGNFNDYDSCSSNQIRRGSEMSKGKNNGKFWGDTQGLQNLGNSKSIGFDPLSNFKSSSKKIYSQLSVHKKLSLRNESQKYLKQHKRLPETHYDEKVMTLNENQHDQEQELDDVQYQINLKQDEIYGEQQIVRVQQHQMRNAVVVNNTKYKQVELDNRDKYYRQQSQSLEQQSQEKSYHAALLTLSENVNKLQDNIQAIQRRVEVLDMKVMHSHERIQKSLFEKLQTKVEQIVQRKLKRIYSVRNPIKSTMENLTQKDKGSMKKKTLQNQIKEQQRRRNFQNEEQKFNYKKNLTKQFFTTKSQQQEQVELEQREKTKSKRRVKENQITKRLPDKEHLARLLQKLSVKLKERQAKLGKMQQRERRDAVKVKGLPTTDRQTTKANNRKCSKRAVTGLLQQ